LKDKFPEYTDPNVWPPSDVLPGFKEAFERLGRLIVDVGTLLAKVLLITFRLNIRLVMSMVSFLLINY
jgi:hypothetical protein